MSALHRISMVATALVLCVLCGAGCISEREPFILLLDGGYSLQLLDTGTNTFESPDGITVASERVAYFTGHHGGTLWRWSPGEGSVMLCDSTAGLASPESIVRTPDGMLYLTDDTAGGLWQCDSTGTLSLLAGPERGLTSTEGIAITPDGALLVGDGMARTIFRVTRAGSVSVFLGPAAGIEKAEAMVFDEQGTLYVADDVQGKVFMVEPDHAPRVLLDGTADIGMPESLAFHHGCLYVTDGANGKLYRWSRARHSLETIAIFHGYVQDVQSIALSDRGSIFVTIRSADPNTGYLFKLESGS